MNDLLFIYGPLIFFIGGYSLALSYWHKKVQWRLRPAPSRFIKIVHYSSVIILCAVLVMYGVSGIGLRGMWTTRIIAIVAFITGIFFNALASREVLKNIVERIYFGMLSLVPPFLAFLLLIPILLFFFVIGAALFIRPVSAVYYNDSKFRVQATPVGFMVPSREDVMEKNFIFEKRLEIDIWSYQVDSVRVSYDGDSTRIKVYGEYLHEDYSKGYEQIIALPK